VRIIQWDDFISGKEKVAEQVSITIGVFDGVHIGHQRLIKAITLDESETIPCIITFKQNPAKVLKNRPFAGSILSLPQKLSKLELFGIRLVILIDFSYEFSKMSGKLFFRFLSERLKIKKIAVGSNFHFGHKKKNSVVDLKRILPGIPVEISDPIDCRGKPVSSTLIRRLIQGGEMNQAEMMLGSRYELDVHMIVPGETEGRFCRISRYFPDQVIPGEGGYEVVLETDNGTIPAHLIIQSDEIWWEKQINSDYSNIKSIIFISKRS
jgi:riboflavin kinase/FMN adenylyltransferase